MTPFSEALAATDKIRLLLDGMEFAVLVDSEAGTLDFDGFVVHVGEGVQRVTAGTDLIFSSSSPTTAVIEAVTAMIASQTKTLLEEALLGEEAHGN